MRAASVQIATDQSSDGFEHLFRQHYPPLVRFVARILGSQTEAEDVAVEAFIGMIAEKSAIQNPGGWLRRCALYLALDRLRSNHRRSARERRVPTESDANSPEAEVIVSQEQARVRFVLSLLSHRDAALLLGRADGHSYRELAELAGVRLTSIGAMLAKAEKRFKQKYEEHHGPR